MSSSAVCVEMHLVAPVVPARASRVTITVMATGLRLIVSIIGFVSAVAASASAQEPNLAWTLRVPDAQGKQPFVQSTSNDRCAAVVTATTVHVISMNGEVMWSWNYRRSSRFLKSRVPYAGEPMALSPSCDRVAMAGDPGYRYVWVAGRDTEAKSTQTVGTPLALAFDLSGDYLAISTGAARGYLMTRDLEPHWIGHLRDFPIRWPEQVLAEPVRAGRIGFTKGSVDALLAVPPWGLWVGDSVSANGQWRVLEQPPWGSRRWVADAGALRSRGTRVPRSMGEVQPARAPEVEQADGLSRRPDHSRRRVRDRKG